MVQVADSELLFSLCHLPADEEQLMAVEEATMAPKSLAGEEVVRMAWYEMAFVSQVGEVVFCLSVVVDLAERLRNWVALCRPEFCASSRLKVRLRMWFAPGLLVGGSVGEVVLRLDVLELLRRVGLGPSFVMILGLNYFQLL